MTDAPASTTVPSAGGASGATPTPSPTPAATPAPTPAPPADQVLATLVAALNGIKATDANTIGGGFETYLDSLLPSPPTGMKSDPCASSPDLSITPACDKRAGDKSVAYDQRDTTCLAAQHDLEKALAAWTSSQKKYAAAATTALTTLRVALKALVDPYQIKGDGTGTGSRSAHLFMTLKESAATSLQAYEAGIATAAGTLATDAGTLLTAYATYISAINGAQADWLVATTTADQTLWGSIEGVHFLD